jgi:PAS domain S-box-containing protein
MKSKKPKSDKQKFISKIYDSRHKWKSDLWILKWIALTFILIDFHWINQHPLFKVDVINLPVFLFFIYSTLFTIFFRNQLSFKIQILSLISDFLIIASFDCLALSIFGYSARIYVLYLIPVIYCSYWFKWTFTAIFVFLVSGTYCILNYAILLFNMGEFFIISEIKGTLAPVVSGFFLVALGVIFFKRKFLKYFVPVDQAVKEHAEKSEQEKEYTRTLLKDKIDGFIVIDEDGYVKEINKLACELFGYNEKEIYTKNVKDLYAPGEAEKIMKKLRNSPDGTIEGFRTFVINKKENKTIPILLSAAFLYDRRNLNFKEELAIRKKFPSLGYFRDLRAEEVFDRIGEESAFMKNEKELLTKISTGISKILKAEFCCIIIYNGTTDQLEIITRYGMPHELTALIEEKKYDEKKGMAGHVFYSGKTLNVKNIDILNKKLEIAKNTPINIALDWNYLKIIADHSKYEDFQHFLGTPLKIQGEVYGVIKVLNKCLDDQKLDKNGFHDEDQNQLERISNQVSFLVEKFRNKERFEAISKIGMELNERLDLPLEDFLEIVNKEVVHGMRFKACFIYIVEEGNKLKIKAYEGLKGDYGGDEKYTLEIGEEISGAVAKTGIHRMIPVINEVVKDSKDIDILKKENLESMLSVPIYYENKSFGVINCCTCREHTFTQEEIQIIQTFAIYTAVAIQNRKRVRELLTLNETGSELVNPFQLEKLFDLILKKAQEISSVDRICIKKYNERTGDISTLSSLDCEWHKQTKNYDLKLGGGFIGEVIKKGDPKIIPNDDFSMEKFSELSNKELFADTKSCMIVPIKIYGKPFGALCLESKEENAFNENDKLLLSTFSTQVAAAIRNADFFSKLQNVKEAFPGISELNIDVHIVLEKIVNTAAGVLETDSLVLFRYDEKTKQIILPAIYTGDIKGEEAFDAETIFLEVPLLLIKEGKSHYAAHSQEDPIMTSQKKVLKEGELFVIRENIVSSAGLILKVGQEIVGVMFINYRSPHDFNDDERQLIEIFASYIAIAIQNVKHFRETKIADTMQTVGKIASNLAHKIKNDLGTITLYTGDLLDEFESDQPQYYPLSQIKEKTSMITKDIDLFQKNSKLYTEEKVLTYVKDIINDLKSEILSELEAKRVELHIEVPANIPKIKIDPIQVKMVLVNLAQNSIEAMPGGGKIYISVSESENSIVIRFTDTGPGIPLGNCQKIFDFNWTTKDKGYGLGLFHAKAIIEEHSGSILLDPTYKKGSQFFIKIPIR